MELANYDENYIIVTLSERKMQNTIVKTISFSDYTYTNMAWKGQE